MNDAVPLTLTYDSFGRLWKALVSKRKARRLQVDKDQAWAQLCADGDSAQFLQVQAERQEAKKAKEAAKSESATAPRQSKPKKSVTKRATKKPAPRKTTKAPVSRKVGMKRPKSATSAKSRRRPAA